MLRAVRVRHAQYELTNACSISTAWYLFNMSFICSSPEWSKINKSEWEKMGLKFEQEGEFWLVLHIICI